MQDPFWNNHYKAFQVQEPSRFSKYVVENHLRSGDQLIELGCGNGRDAGLLSRHVARYVGTDACPAAIESCSKNLAALGEASTISLRCADFTSLDFNNLAEGAGRLVVYSRFSLHSVTYAEAERLLSNLEKISVAPWIFLLEARTIYDELYGVGEEIGLHEFKTDHYRRFLDPAVFLQQLATKFAVKYFDVSKGFAPFGKQDPLVLRTVFAGRGASLLAL